MFLKSGVNHLKKFLRAEKMQFRQTGCKFSARSRKERHSEGENDKKKTEANSENVPVGTPLAV